MTSLLRKPWWLGLLALGMWQGCGEPRGPMLGPNLVRNGSFETGLDGWWKASDSEESTAATSAEAADFGLSGLALHNTTGGLYSMVGQETQGHEAGQTFQVDARLKGAVGGEHVSFNYHGQGFEMVAEDRWRTVSRLVLMPEVTDDSNFRISVASDGATVYVDEVSIALAQVERGDADDEIDNLVRNGSFESDLGLWTFWTNSLPDGSASTSPDARRSGYAGMVLTRGADGAFTLVKQSLPDPIARGEEYRLEMDVRGTHGGEMVNLCMQMNREPWDGPCISVTAGTDWQHVSKKVTLDDALIDERVGAVVSLGSEGTVMVDDVIVIRTQQGR